MYPILVCTHPVLIHPLPCPLPPTWAIQGYVDALPLASRLYSNPMQSNPVQTLACSELIHCCSSSLVCYLLFLNELDLSRFSPIHQSRVVPWFLFVPVFRQDRRRRGVPDHVPTILWRWCDACRTLAKKHLNVYSVVDDDVQILHSQPSPPRAEKKSKK